MNGWKKTTIAALIAAGLVLSQTPAASAWTTYTRPAIRLAYAGDSTTAQDGNWREHLDKRLVTDAQGFAKSGATSSMVAKKMPVSRSDVLIVKVGINDGRYLSGNVWTVRRAVRDIIRKAGYQQRPHRVLISAIAPNDKDDFGVYHLNRSQFNMDVNAALQSYAVTHGHQFIDPDAGYRTDEGKFVTGYTDDGTHPNEALYRIEAKAIQAKVIEMVSPRKTK